MTVAEAERDRLLEVDVLSKTEVADGVVELRLRTADGSPLPSWSAGAHIDLLLPGDRVRQYSLCGSVEDSSTWRIGVLRERDGRGGSAWIHDELQPGRSLTVSTPRNHFRLESMPHMIFLAGGIGITPILPMLEEADQRGLDWSLWYGGRTAKAMAFTSELQRWSDRVTLWPQDERGLLPLRHLLSTPRENTRVYACGPPSLLSAVETAMSSWHEGHLRVERFSAQPQVQSEPERPIEVSLAASGVTIEVASTESVLEAVRRAGIDVLSSCGQGTCGTCEVVVLDGVPDHRDAVLDASERAANDRMLICVSRAMTPRLVLDI